MARLTRTGSARLGIGLGLVALLIGGVLAPISEAQRPPRPGRSVPTAEPGPGVILQHQRFDVPTADGRVLVTAVARPRTNGPFPVIVVLHGSEGFRPHYVDLANRFADAGYVALAGAWFSGSRSGAGRAFSDVIPCPQCPEFRGANQAALPYVQALIDAARKLPDVRADRVGVFGHSAGAGMSILAASSGATVQAVVVSGAGFSGGPRGGDGLMETARTLGAPLLILHGTADDQTSVDGARQYEALLKQLGKPVEAAYFPGAPHQMTWEAPTDATIRDRAVAFFRAHLSGDARAQSSPPAPAGTAQSTSPTTPAPRAMSAGATYDGPFFDAHAHMLREGVGAMGRGSARGTRPMPPASGGRPDSSGVESPGEIVDRLRAAGVSGMFLFAAPPHLQQRNPDLVYAFVTVPHSPSGPAFDDQAPTAIERSLAAGARGIGELPLRHKPTGNLHAADGPIPMRIYELAARHQAPVTVHVEHEYVRELERALSKNPKTMFVWAHVGSGPASLARELLRRYDNLSADLSTRNPIIRMGIPVEQNSLTDSGGRLKGEWRQVLEEFPDRFLAGLDINNTDRLQSLDELVRYYRAVLAQLPPAIAEKIAYRNARRLLRIEDR